MNISSDIIFDIVPCTTLSTITVRAIYIVLYTILYKTPGRIPYKIPYKIAIC